MSGKESKAIEKIGKFPYYDTTSHTWKLITELGLEEGNATYIASEQERELLNCLKVKLRKNFKEN